MSDVGSKRSLTKKTRQEQIAKQRARRKTIWTVITLVVIVSTCIALAIVFIKPKEQEQSLTSLQSNAINSGSIINKTDPISGKPVVPYITSTYKGYTIGHCCEVSKGEWEKLSPSQKDELIKPFLN